ncbi:MAG: hypothetical protein AAF517_00445 [Planctomycetota bacterium]
MCDSLPDPDTDDSQFLPKLVPLVELLAVKAHSEARAGRFDEAFRWCLDIRRFGEKYRSGERLGIHFSVGAGIERNYGISNLLIILHTYDVPDDALAKLAKSFPGDTDATASASLTLRYEYQQFRKFVEDPFRLEAYGLDRPDWWERFGYRPNETLHKIANLTRETLRVIEARDGTNPLEVVQSAKHLGAFNDCGRRVFDVYLTNESIVDDLLSLHTEYRLASVFFAAEQFRRSTGSLPKTLEDLVGRYLKEVPRDPFLPKNRLRLRKDGVVYSVGMDRVDDGGRQRQSIARVEAAAELDEIEAQREMAGDDDDEEDEDEEFDVDEDGGADEEDPRDDWQISEEDDTSLELLIPAKENEDVETIGRRLPRGGEE